MTRAVLALAAILSVGTAAAVAQRQAYDPGNGVTLPVLVKEVKPAYTKAAQARKVQGSVLLKGIVESDGSVGEVTVLRSLDPDLDQQAIAAFKRWEFEPGTREGKPVAVRITCELTFTLK